MIEVEIGKNSFNNGVFNFFNSLSRFGLGVNNSVVVIKNGREKATANVAILIDGRTNDCATMLMDPCGVVCSSAKKRDAEGGL